jgi:hypothetical protein
VTVVIFALGECLFGALALGNVDDGDRDADDLVDLIACRLEGDEGSVVLARLIWTGIGDFDARDRLALECATKVRLELLIEAGMDFEERSAKVFGYGKTVHLGEALVDADVAQIAVEEA